MKEQSFTLLLLTNLVEDATSGNCYDSDYYFGEMDRYERLDSQRQAGIPQGEIIPSYDLKKVEVIMSTSVIGESYCESV